jgi:hypothetical protein
MNTDTKTDTVSFGGVVISTPPDNNNPLQSRNDFSFLGFGFETNKPLQFRFSVRPTDGGVGPDGFADDVDEAGILHGTLELTLPDRIHGSFSYSKTSGEACSASTLNLEQRPTGPRRSSTGIPILGPGPVIPREPEQGIRDRTF